MLVGTAGLEAFSPTPPRAGQPVEHGPRTDAPPVQPPADPAADAVLTSGDDATRDETLVTPEALQRLVAVRVAHPKAMGPEVECMAKVIYHEAANQALQGQLAVAQVIQNRTRGGPIFPSSICGVVNQQGQFFQTRAFRAPLSDAARWRMAVAVAFVAQEHKLAQVAPGALFYHAAYAHPAWRRRHQQIARVGDQIFYR